MLLLLDDVFEEALFERMVADVLNNEGNEAESVDEVGAGVAGVASVPVPPVSRLWRRGLLRAPLPAPSPVSPPSSSDSVDALATVVDADGFPLLLARRAVSRFHLSRLPAVPPPSSSSSPSPRRTRRHRGRSPRYTPSSPPRCVRRRKR